MSLCYNYTFPSYTHRHIDYIAPCSWSEKTLSEKCPLLYIFSPLHTIRFILYLQEQIHWLQLIWLFLNCREYVIWEFEHRKNWLYTRLRIYAFSRVQVSRLSCTDGVLQGLRLDNLFSSRMIMFNQFLIVQCFNVGIVFGIVWHILMQTENREKDKQL